MSERVVVDASLAIKWVLPEANTPEARSLLIEWTRGSVTRLVPSVFFSEVNTPLLRLRRQSLITQADADRARGDLWLAVTVDGMDASLAGRAFAIADGLAQRAAYDSLHLALAEREECELWTADAALVRAARPIYPFVRLLGEPLTALSP